MLLEKETDLVRDLGKKIVDREIDRSNKKKNKFGNNSIKQWNKIYCKSN